MVGLITDHLVSFLSAACFRNSMLYLSYSDPAYSLLTLMIVPIHTMSSGIISREWLPQMLTYTPKHWSQVNMLEAHLRQRRFAPSSLSSFVHISDSSSSISMYLPATTLLANLGGTRERPLPM